MSTRAGTGSSPSDRCHDDGMSVVALLDVAAGTTLAVVGVFAVVRSMRAVGLLLLLASAAWFVGSWWPPAGVAHRLPLVLAIVLSMTWSSWRIGAFFLAGLGAVAAVSVVRPTGWTTLFLGLLLATASHVLLRGGSPFGSVAPGLVFGYPLVALGILRLEGAPTTAPSAGYSLALLVVSFLLLRRCYKLTAADVVVQLAAMDTDTLSTRLRLLLGDARLAVDLGNGPPDLLPGTAVVALTRDELVVGHLRHAQDRRPDRRLVNGLGALAGLMVDAQALRARSLATLADLDAANEDFRMARARGAAALSLKLRSGPLAHLARAQAKITDPGLVSELRRARHELESVSEELVDPMRVVEDWQPALARRIALSPIPVSAHAASDLRGVPERVGHEALLACSEALSNAAKHSGATSIRLTVTLSDRTLHVEVVDNGTGGAHPGGFGLRGLRKRVERCGGGLDLDSRPSAGTAVHFWLSCDEDR